MTTTEIGKRAEAAVVKYLQEEGYEVLEQNWKRPHCEIDIVAQLEDVLYFVEVKYRASDQYGNGLEYISAEKLHHMTRAAESWVSAHQYSGEYQLAAIAVTGRDFAVTDFIESIY